MSPPANDRRAGLKPPQFNLRTMLLAVAIVSVLIALMTSVGPLAAFGILLLVLSIIAHVAGNALGTRLRENGNRPLEAEPENVAARRAKTQTPLPSADFAPDTRLGGRHALGWTTIAAVLVGGLFGAGLGGTFLAWLCWDKATTVGIVCGAAASGALGGFAGFLLGSFIGELLRAYLQAVRPTE